MEALFQKSYVKINNTNTTFVRYLMHSVDWSGRLIGMKAPRGAGKTTLLLQYA